MAITENNVQTSATDTLSYTPASVTDSCLVVIASSEDLNRDEPMTALNFGAAVMEGFITGKGDNGTHSRDIAMAFLANPGTSAETITVTGGQSDRVGIVALTLDNVDQITPLDISIANGFISGTALTSTETTTNDDSFVVSGAMTDSDLDTLSVTGATEIVEFAPPSSKLAAATSTQVTAGVYSHNWVSSTSVAGAASASMAFNLASAGGVSITVLRRRREGY